jgi:hypothetical protein
MPRRQRAEKRFMAILDGRSGYALDYYPEEKGRYLRQFAGRYPGRVIGDFSTAEEALNALRRRLKKRAPGACSPLLDAAGIKSADSTRRTPK